MKPSTFQISGSRVVFFAEDVGLVASLNGNHKLTLLQRVPWLSTEKGWEPTSGLNMSCFKVLFRSRGAVEHEIYGQFCVVFAVMWPLYWSVVVKTELPLYCFFGVFFVHSYPHLRPTKIILQIQAAETVPGLRERNSELLLQQIRRTLLQWFRRLSRNCQNVCGEGFEHVQLGLSPRAFPGKAEEIMSLSWLDEECLSLNCCFHNPDLTPSSDSLNTLNDTFNSWDILIYKK